MSREDTVHLLCACADCLLQRRDTMEEILIELYDPELQKQICRCMDVQQALQWQTGHLLQQCGETIPRPHPLILLPDRVRVRLKMKLRPSCASAAEILTDDSRRTVRRLCRVQNHAPDAAIPAKTIAEAICRTEETLTDAIKSYL